MEKLIGYVVINDNQQLFAGWEGRKRRTIAWVADFQNRYKPAIYPTAKEAADNALFIFNSTGEHCSAKGVLVDMS